ncbi:MAG TPA: prolyl oligopeptidase family serine peptidase, partial [Candidatus Saccharimonadales bacterium]|nr:prolyl oligopeptidase family serine peptidase [Candidatus Saccharimonadales bacterium]
GCRRSPRLAGRQPVTPACRSGRPRRTAWLMALCLGAAPILWGIGCGPDHEAPPPPETRREPVTDHIHGVDIVDDYRWLEDGKSPETRAWIDAQEKYAHQVLDGLPGQDGIRTRMEQLLRIDRIWAPVVRGGRYFYWKQAADADLSSLYMREGPDGEEVTLLDPDTLSEDHRTGVSLESISSDGKLLAYGVRLGGQDEVEVHVLDVDSRSDLPDVLPRGLYTSMDFTADGATLYYGARDRKTGGRVMRHVLGTDVSGDTLVFGGDRGPEQWIAPSISEDGRYLLVSVQHGWANGEVFVQDLERGGPILPVAKNVKASFTPAIAGDTLVMMTDWDAPNRRIISFDLTDPALERWKEIVPEGPDTLTGFSLAGGRLFLHYLHDVSSKILIRSLDGKDLGTLELPGLGTAGPPTGSWKSDEAFYSFASWTTPRTIYRYQISTRASTVWAKDETPVDPDLFEVKQIWYRSKDDTRVPMFLVERRGLQLDGNRPVLLYGYGGFDVSMTPRFVPTAVWWAEHNGVYAVANIRGGGEFGEKWHHAGMLGNKQNVFDDFIAAAEALTQEGWTRPSRLAIQGGSNGGLLMGAVLTQRPDLFQAVLCQHPDLDMIRYNVFEGNNPPALLEYGDASDPEQFEFLRAYSPYQAVKKGVKYPAVLITSGDADTRVPPLQARKMTAVLQWATASDRPILLLYDTKAGHAGSRPLPMVIDDLTLEISFLAWQVGME